ncbi:MAG TPA: peptidylprolyl isomerase [Methylomirabilota bacterium]|nr:peptidylprolyl isomerase [Methylomirabilota bacterium]
MRAACWLGLLLLGAALTGCSIPSWVPYFGKDPRAAAPVAEPPPPPSGSAPILSKPLPLSEDEVVDRVICVVNSDAITLYELDEEEARYLYESKDQPPRGDARRQLRERLLTSMIENRIQIQQAEREKIVVEDSEIQASLNEVMKRSGAKDLKELDEFLKGHGLSVEGIKKRLREQAQVTRLISRKVGQRVTVTEKEIDRYLAENREKLETGLEFHARHILFLPEAGKGADGWAAARRKADEVYALIVDSQDFGELARKYSEDGSAKDGGNLGKLKRGELAPDIEKAILSLKPGETSPPFRSQVGWHLFHLDAAEGLSGEALTQARSQIRDILYRQKYEGRLKDYLAELKQRAIIDIRM